MRGFFGEAGKIGKSIGPDGSWPTQLSKKQKCQAVQALGEGGNGWGRVFSLSDHAMSSSREKILRRPERKDRLRVGAAITRTNCPAPSASDWAGRLLRASCGLAHVIFLTRRA